MEKSGTVEIRLLGLDELELLLQWRMQVLDEVFGSDSVADAGRDLLEDANRAYYERELAAGTHIACMAEVDGIPVGCGGACIQEEMPSPDNPSGRCAYLMNVYTEPGHQRQGVGRAVVARLVEEAKARGAQKIYLETSASGRPLYKGMGFADMPDMLKLREDED